MRVLVAGSNGLIGGAVARHLRGRGHDVVALVRRNVASREIRWDPDEGSIDAAALEGFDAVLDFATAPWTGRWTKSWKRRMLTNRVASNGLLAEALAGRSQKPRVLVAASGMGIYRPAGDDPIDESGAVGSDFLAELQRVGEQALDPAAAAGIRTVALRLPTVLGGPGLPDMTRQLRRIGSGTQWLSWIALTDVVRAVDHAIATEALAGGVNTCSPNPVRNADFPLIVAEVTHSPAGRPISAFMLRLMVGELADALIIASRRMQPTRLLETGFRFAYPELADALRHELPIEATRAPETVQ